MSESRQQAFAPVSDPGPVGKVSRPAFTRTLTFFGFFAITASMVMTVMRLTALSMTLASHVDLGTLTKFL